MEKFKKSQNAPVIIVRNPMHLQSLLELPGQWHWQLEAILARMARHKFQEIAHLLHIHRPLVVGHFQWQLFALRNQRLFARLGHGQHGGAAALFLVYMGD